MGGDFLYTGIREVILDDTALAKFYEFKEPPIQLYENEYLLIKDKSGKYIDKFRFNGERLVKLNYKRIQNTYADKIKPLNVKQECMFDLLQNKKIKVKLITGNMGGGKSYISVLHALDWVEKDVFKKLVYIRNNAEVADVGAKLGALPGSIKEKLNPFILHLGDVVGSIFALEQLERQEKIEYVHLGFVRGRDFSNSVVICNESGNLTKDHVKLLLIIFEGDTEQVDKNVYRKNSGIQALRDILKGNPLFGAVELDKSERSDVAELSRLF